MKPRSLIVNLSQEKRIEVRSIYLFAMSVLLFSSTVSYAQDSNSGLANAKKQLLEQFFPPNESVKVSRHGETQYRLEPYTTIEMGALAKDFQWSIASKRPPIYFARSPEMDVMTLAPSPAVEPEEFNKLAIANLVARYDKGSGDAKLIQDMTQVAGHAQVFQGYISGKLAGEPVFVGHQIVYQDDATLLFTVIARSEDKLMTLLSVLIDQQPLSR